MPRAHLWQGQLPCGCPPGTPSLWFCGASSTCLLAWRLVAFDFRAVRLTMCCSSGRTSRSVLCRWEALWRWEAL